MNTKDRPHDGISCVEGRNGGENGGAPYLRHPHSIEAPKKKHGGWLFLLILGPPRSYMTRSFFSASSNLKRPSEGSTPFLTSRNPKFHALGLMPVPPVHDEFTFFPPHPPTQHRCQLLDRCRLTPLLYFAPAKFDSSVFAQIL